MNVLGLIIVFVGLAFGLFVGSKGKTKHIEIQYSYRHYEWLMPTMSLFALFVIGFLLEIILAFFLSDVIKDSYPVVGLINPVLTLISSVIELIGLLIDNGLLVLVCSCFIYIRYEKSVESLNLDYMEEYTQNVPKVCFSIIVLMVCIVLYLNIDYFGFDKLIKEFVLNRFAVWILYIGGLWLAVDNICKGRLWKEKYSSEKTGITKEKQNNNNNQKKRHRIWFPIGISFIICFLILLWSLFFNNSELNYYFFASFVVYIVSVIVTLYINQRKTHPSEKLSIKKFREVEQFYKDGSKRVKSRFGLMSYVIEDDELIILKTDVGYKGHENDEDFKELFKEKSYAVVDDSDWDEVLDKLVKRNKAQKEYIRKGYEACTEEKRMKKKKYI